MMGIGGFTAPPDTHSQGWAPESAAVRAQQDALHRDRRIQKSREASEARRSQRESRERSIREARAERSGSTLHRRSLSRRRSESFTVDPASHKPSSPKPSSRKLSVSPRRSESSAHRRSTSLTRNTETKTRGRSEKKHTKTPASIYTRRPENTQQRRSRSESRDRTTAVQAAVKASSRTSVERTFEPLTQPTQRNVNGSLSLIWAFTELRLRRVDQGLSCVHFDPSKDVEGCRQLSAKMHRKFGMQSCRASSPFCPANTRIISDPAVCRSHLGAPREDLGPVWRRGRIVRLVACLLFAGRFHQTERAAARCPPGPKGVGGP